MFRSAGLTFGSKLLTAGVNFAIVVWLSRWLGEAGKGQCSLYVLIFSAALILSECISGAAIGFLLSKYSHRQLLLLFYGWSALAALLTGTFFLLIHKIVLTETVLVILLCWLNAVITIQQQTALARQKIGLFNGLNIVQALLTGAAVGLLFLFAAKAPVTYLWALGAAWLPVAVAGFFLTYFLPQHHPFTSWGLLAKAGFRAGMANQASTFIQLINARIAFVLLPAAGTGIYSNALSICEACLLLNYSIGTVQYSRVVAYQSNNEFPEIIRHRQHSITHQCFWINAILMAGALLILAIIPSGFFTWLFGPRFSAVDQPLHLLLPGIFLYSGFIIFSYYFSGTGRFLLNSIPTAAGLVVTLAGYCWVKWTNLSLGIVQAAFIQTCSYAAIFFAALLLFLHREKITLRQWLQVPWQSIKNDFLRKENK